MTLAIAASALALVAPMGDGASARASGTTLSLTLHYLMTCGQPGPGPLVVQLPASFRLVRLQTFTNGVERARAVNDSTVTIDVPGPQGVTCMSIAEGTLRVRLIGVAAKPGRYTIRAQIRSHAFAARLRIR